MSKENIEKLESALGRLETKENVIYFLTYDTKNNARASIKHIYDMALTLKENGHTPKILTEDKSYIKPEWLGEKYDDLELVSIKEDKVNIQIDDVIVVPEYYSNVLQQLSNVRCTKVMLVQQKEYIFETLPVTSLQTYKLLGVSLYNIASPHVPSNFSSADLIALIILQPLSK